MARGWPKNITLGQESCHIHNWEKESPLTTICGKVLEYHGM